MGIEQIYADRKKLGNKITLRVNGKKYNVSDWIADIAFRADDIKDSMSNNHVDTTQRSLFNIACDKLYDIVNDNWKDEYSN